jgi:hypothetical protein
MCKFPVGTRVVVSVPVEWSAGIGNPAPFTAVVSRVIFADSRMGGYYNIVADDGRVFEDGAEGFCGDWLAPVADGAVFAHRDALVAIGGGA